MPETLGGESFAEYLENFLNQDLPADEAAKVLADFLGVEPEEVKKTFTHWKADTNTISFSKDYSSDDKIIIKGIKDSGTTWTNEQYFDENGFVKKS